MTKEAPAAAPEKPKHDGKAMIPATSYQHTMEPRNFEEIKELAKLLAGSDIVPKDLQGKPANVLVVLMFGRELGISTAQALQNVMVVNGRPAMWGDAVIGKVEASGVMEWWRDAFDEKTMTATFTVKRKGKPEPTVRTFSQADAQKAGLWSKQGPWSQYPKRMLFCRARAFALRDTFADVLKGLRIAEEDRDIIEVTPQSDGTYAMPRATGETVPATATATETVPAAASVAETDAAPTTFVIEKATSQSLKDRPTRYWVYFGDLKAYTEDEGTFKAAKGWAESKTPVVRDLEKAGDDLRIVELAPAA